MSKRLGFFITLVSLGIASQALAGGDQTPASAAINLLGLSAQAWGFAIAGVAFITAIAAKLLEHFYDIRSLSGGAINVLIGVGLISSAVAIIGTAGAAAGAELPPLPASDLLDLVW